MLTNDSVAEVPHSGNCIAGANFDHHRTLRGVQPALLERVLLLSTPIYPMAVIEH